MSVLGAVTEAVEAFLSSHVPIPLHSSFLTSATYDAETMELTISFQNGDEHVYTGVSPVTAAGLATAPSPGAYYNQFIKIGTRRAG